MSIFSKIFKSPEPKDLVVHQPQVPAMTIDKVVSYLDAMGLSSQLTPEEKELFITIAVDCNLNPFKREVYCIPYTNWKNKRSLSIVTGYEVYLKRAETSEQLDGWNVEFEGEVPKLTAIITIKRKDRSEPLVHSVDYSEYVQMNNKGVPNKFWKEKPKTMLRKVAISQGFRLAFPVELGGMPYTSDELPEEMTGKGQRNVTPPPPEKKREKSVAKKSKAVDVVVETKEAVAEIELQDSPELENARKEARKAFDALAPLMDAGGKRAYADLMKEAVNSVEGLEDAKKLMVAEKKLREQRAASKAEKAPEDIVQEVMGESELEQKDLDIY